MAAEPSQGGALDPAFVADWSARYLAAWNAGDGAAVAALCSEDVEWYDPGLPAAVQGRAAVQQFVEDTFRAFPDFQVEELAPPLPSPEEPLVLSLYRFSGTMTGPWEPRRMAATGARMSVRGVDEWRFRDGLMHAYATHYDSLDMVTQLGALPPPGSAAERLVVPLQHLQARFQRRRAGAS